ncbi:hypothetical protein DY000_02036734 [Brassica cretica]|uniref:Mos1 transposase HTH domain-containing protein n=1 Tax=Brassica cretica TaxID=69181 RepID=A0ABQ7BEJ2_BRACR|nr:hypothetical protein DY000_02036734 [Brassica cretica]
MLVIQGDEKTVKFCHQLTPYGSEAELKIRHYWNTRYADGANGRHDHRKVMSGGASSLTASSRRSMRHLYCSHALLFFLK